jgi:hypothetical protein
VECSQSAAVESGADWELMECELDDKLVLGDAQAADGGESSIPVDLDKGSVGPMVAIEEVGTEPGAARCIK